MLLLSKISEREKDVLELVAQELTSKEISRQLYISTNTVNTHKKNIREKMEVKSLAGMVRKGFEIGLLRV